MTITINPVNMDQETAQWCFNAAENYLKQSDLAAFLIEELKSVPEVLTINITADDPEQVGNTWAPPSDDSAGTVTWNVKRTLIATEKESKKPDATSFETFLALFKIDKQQSMSPALLLMHELGHACQYMSGVKNEMFERRDKSDKEWKLDIENINVNAIENTVANELKEKGSLEGIRWNYLDAKLS